MKETYHDNVESETDTSHNHNQEGILDNWEVISNRSPEWVETGIRLMSMNLSTDWMTMPSPRAKRKTPLKNAPRRVALCQPNERAWGEVLRSDIYQRDQHSQVQFIRHGEVGSAYYHCRQGHYKTDEIVQLRGD